MLGGMEYPFHKFGSAALSMFILKLLPTSACLLWRQSEKKRNPECCASAAQQQLKHHSVINIVLVTDLKLNKIWAAMKKINTIPDKITTLTGDFHFWVMRLCFELSIYLYLEFINWNPGSYFQFYLMQRSPVHTLQDIFTV